jgi:fructokinase
VVAGSRAFVVGEALVDIVLPVAGGREEAPGGSPLNIAVGLSRLGVPTTLLTALGYDERGTLVRRHVEDSGVVLDAVPMDRTNTATAHLDATGAATYDFDLRWELEPRALPPGVELVHVGSLGTALRPGREQVLELLAQAARRGLLVTFDPNARPALTPDAAAAWADVREVAAAADVVKLSDEDLAFLRPGIDPASLARELLTGRTSLVVVTAGGAGATAFSDGAAVEVGSGTVTVADTVGAGDSFMAALVAVVLEHGLHRLDTNRLRSYVEAAHQAAAVTVSRRGADPPVRAELPSGWPHVQ